MKYIKVVSSGGKGALIITKEPITNSDRVSVGLNEKEDVLHLQKILNEFVENNYSK